MLALLSVGFLCLAQTALCGSFPGPVVGLSIPTPTADSNLVGRDTNMACATSLINELSPAAPTDTRILSEIDATSCTITAPASLSSPLMSYASELATYLSTIESKAKGIHTDCGAKEKLTLSISSYLCSKSIEILFVDKSSSTKTTSVSVPNSFPTKIVVGSGAAPRHATASVGVAFIAGAMTISALFW